MKLTGYRTALAVAGALLTANASGVLANEDQDLAKASQNPIGDLISLPFENNFDFDTGPEDALVYKLNLKPVYPTELSDDLLLINRGIAPIIYQDERFEGEGSEFGLGDLTYQGFLTPKAPGAVLWGAGPALTIPTATDERLGTEKWSAGPALVVLAKPGPWLFGSLISQSWSFAGDDDRDNVNQGTWQYFINYNFESGYYFSSTPTMVANWDEDSDNRYTIPVGGGIGKLVRFGTLPVDIKGQVFWNAEKPDGAAPWSAQLQVKFLFPK